MELHSPAKEQLKPESPNSIEAAVQAHDRAMKVAYLCATLLFIGLLIVLVF